MDLNWIQFGKRHNFVALDALISKFKINLYYSHLLFHMSSRSDCNFNNYSLYHLQSFLNRLIYKNYNLDLNDFQVIDNFHSKVIRNLPKNANTNFTISNGYLIHKHVEARCKIHEQVSCALQLAELSNMYDNTHFNLDLLYERERILFNSVDIVLCPSQSVVEYVRSFNSDIKTILFNYQSSISIDRSTSEYRTSSLLSVLFVGRFCSTKGSDIILKLAKNHPDVLFNIAGSVIDSFDKLPNLKFHGYLNKYQLIKLYETVDVYLHPSKSEGSSVAVMDAFMAGIPAIVSVQSGSLYSHGVTGFVLDCYDYDSFNTSLSVFKRDRLLLNEFSRKINAHIKTDNFLSMNYSSVLFNTLCQNLD